jgi:hypothetical protein
MQVKFGDKFISDLTDKELVDAGFKLAAMLARHADAENDPRFAKRFAGQPERVLNPYFVNVQNAVKSEIENRKLNNA